MDQPKPNQVSANTSPFKALSAELQKEAILIHRPDNVTDDEWRTIANKINQAIELGMQVMAARVIVEAIVGHRNVAETKDGELVN